MPSVYFGPIIIPSPGFGKPNQSSPNGRFMALDLPHYKLNEQTRIPSGIKHGWKIPILKVEMGTSSINTGK